MKQYTALDILKTGQNVFLTGSAGAGKTYTLNQYINYLRARRVPVAITASTGIAATHMNGITIHSWSGIGIKTDLNDKDLIKIYKRKNLKDRIQDTAVLIIDEISMLHAKQLDAVNKVLKYVRNSDDAFGGVQVVLAGDFFQLPPVGDKEETNRDKFAFMSEAWLNAEFQICYLSEQYRQQDYGINNGLTLNDILNQIRSSQVTHDSVYTLESTINNEVNPNRTRLYTHNVSVDRINQTELDKLGTSSKTFSGEIDGDEKLTEILKKTVRTSEELMLKIGAKVMFIKNISELNVSNGTMGEIIGFHAIPIESDDEDDSNQTDNIPTIEYPVVRLNTGREVIATPEEWMVEDEQGDVIASYSQVPLCLAWAITVHKSQGMTLDAAEIDLSRTFEMGQGYVALSRLKDLSGLKLLGINTNSLRLDPLARGADKRFMELSDILQATHDLLDLNELEEVHKGFILSSGGTINQKLIDSYEKNRQKKLAREIKVKHKKTQGKNDESTFDKTKKLVEEKLSIYEISQERELAQSTIMGHISKLKTMYSDLDCEYLRPADELIELVEEAYRSIILVNDPNDFDQEGNIRLKPIYEALEEKINWNSIRLALIFVDPA